MRLNLKQLQLTRRSLLWLCRVMRMRCMTACSVLDSSFLSRLGAHHARRASKETTASHPDRYADAKKQPHCLVREEQTHFPAWSLLPATWFVEKRARKTIVIKTQHFRNRSLVSLNLGDYMNMSIDKNKIKTQDELNEPAPIDQAEQRVEAEMKKMEEEAKKEVAEGLKQQSENK
jgi:hypothetical protein